MSSQFCDTTCARYLAQQHVHNTSVWSIVQAIKSAYSCIRGGTHFKICFIGPRNKIVQLLPLRGAIYCEKHLFPSKAIPCGWLPSRFYEEVALPLDTTTRTHARPIFLEVKTCPCSRAIARVPSLIWKHISYLHMHIVDIPFYIFILDLQKKI